MTVKSINGDKFEVWEKAVLVPIERLVFTDWNCNEMSPERQAQLVASIENTDDPNDPRFDEPLQIVPVEGDDKYLVLGGEHRTKAMAILNQTHIPCVIRQDFIGKSRKELMLYSVQRNNLRGKLNAQKYAALEAELINDYEMTVEAARQTMLVEGDLAKALKAALASNRPRNDDDNDKDHDGDKPSTEFPELQQELTKQRDKAELLQALKVAEQDVLLDSADTVEFGYLFFAQGKNGALHLVVDCSEELLNSVRKLVNHCKADNKRIDTFLKQAIDKKLEGPE